MSDASLPPAFLERLARIVPPERLPAVRATFEAPAATGFRAVPLVAPEADTLARLTAEGVPFMAVEGVLGAFAVPAGARAALLASGPYREGHLYVQNVSSQLPPLLLGARPGERVLDLCAAPGSKTGQVAALMQNEGTLDAVEKVRARYYKLRANVEAQGATLVRAHCASGTAFWHRAPESYDRVLLDAPCSTEGRFHTADPESVRYWSPRKVKEMRAKQQRLLFAAVQALRPGGTLVYATCTFAPEENEGVLTKALRTFGGRLEVVEAGLPETGPVAAAALPGLASWEGRPFHPQVTRARRVLPDGLLEGFFVARLVKHDSTAGPPGAR
ncbi:MAG: RsmB/NOP family class I SAM-dependent RNA methyltransferase [Rubricoccaceae bacterium]